MNKTILIIAILACCLPTNVLSAESENRELAGINLGNLGNAIGGIIGAIKNNTSTTTPANNSTTPVSNSTSSTPANNNTSTSPVKNTTSPTNSTTTTPVTNNTSSIPANNTNTAPVSNNTSSTPANNNTSTTPVQNTTSPTNSSTTPVVNNTQPADPDSDAESSDTDSSTNTTNTTTPAPAPVKYAKNDVNMATFKDDCLTVHNQVRKDVGLNNLTWSDSLAASAQAWAENMAKNGFRHSGKTGENIASSTYSTKTLSRLLGLWTKEKNYYIVGCKYPSCSSTSAEVGHYTQMVWWSTTQVGCGFAPGYNRGYNYLCCQYYKAGNIRGQYVYPVPTA